MGDTTALESISVALRAAGFGQIDLLRFEPHSSPMSVSGYGREVKPAGDLRHKRVGDAARLCRLLSGYDAFYAWGADVIDGVYGPEDPLAIVRLCDLAARTGLDTRILGFSWSETPNGLVRETISALRRVQFLVRDPISRKRFERDTAQKSTQVADVAFLFEPIDASPVVHEIAEWMDVAVSNGKRVIGLNTSAFALGSTSFDEISEHLRRITGALTRVRDRIPEIAILPFPHDLRDREGNLGDLDLSECIRQYLEGAGFGAIPSFPRAMSPSDVDFLARRCDVMITGRMHLGIAALRSGIPVLCIPYQGKFDGLLELLELPDLILDNATLADESVLGARITEFLEKSSELRLQVSERMERIRELSGLNYRAATS